jgi:hypothetical protein
MEIPAYHGQDYEHSQGHPSWPPERLSAIKRMKFGFYAEILVSLRCTLVIRSSIIEALKHARGSRLYPKRR